MSNSKIGKNARDEQMFPDSIFYNNIKSDEELLNIFGKETTKSDKQIYSEMKKDLHLDAFMFATNNNLDMLFNYIYTSRDYKFGLSDVFIVKFIKNEYNDKFERKV